MGSWEVLGWLCSPSARTGGDKSYPFRPGSIHCRALFCSECWGFCTHLCLFRVFAPIPQMLGLSSKLHPSLGRGELPRPRCSPFP